MEKLFRHTTILVDFFTPSKEFFDTVIDEYPGRIRDGQIRIDDSEQCGCAGYWVSNLSLPLIQDFLIERKGDYELWHSRRDYFIMGRHNDMLVLTE